MQYYATDYGHEELYHYGTKGMKWGVRRYQHEDGTRTALGKKHEAQLDDGRSPAMSRKALKAQYRSNVKAAKQARKKRFNKMNDEYDKELYRAEKHYRRGEKLSDEDQARLSKAGDKFNREFDASNKQYKSDRAAAKESYKRALAEGKRAHSRKALREQYRSELKSAKQAKRQRFNKMNDRYDKELSRVEGTYRRGENLSSRDQARLAKAGDRFNREYAASKAKYKSDRAAAKESYRRAKKEARRWRRG